MKDKLTLSIDKEIIKFAHGLSEKTDQSISSMVEKYFIDLKEVQNKDQEISSRVKKLTGIFAGEEFPEDKKEMRKIFHEKSSD